MDNISKDISPQVNIGKNPSRESIYNAINNNAEQLVRKLLFLSEYGESEKIQLQATTTLLAKIIPDLKATELSGKDGETLAGLITIIKDSAIK